MENRIDHIIYQYLLDFGFAESIANQVQFVLEILVLILLCLIADRIAKKVFVRIISVVIKRTKFVWDDVLLDNKVFDRLAHLAPAIVVQATATYVFEDFHEFIPFVIRMADAYMIGVGLMVVISIFNNSGDISVNLSTNTLTFFPGSPFKSLLTSSTFLFFMLISSI